MKSTYFSNRKSLEIVSPKIKDDIRTLISNIGNFNLTSKYYTFLNKKNVNNLLENNFLVSLSTFGKKIILFITNYNTKKYCIFINKKNDSMIVTQLKFTDDIFLGTLFDGELIKNSNGKWIYLINDIAYYKGSNIVTTSFLERQSIIDNILQNEHEHEYYDENQSFYISRKTFFEYENLKDLVENYSKHLNYKCSGLYFKNMYNFGDNYLFIFHECRSDNKILNNIKNEVIILEEQEDDLFKDVDSIFTKSQHPPINKLEKTTCRFLILQTLMPDIYELHCNDMNGKAEKYSYASVPDIETSNFIKNIMTNSGNIYVECNYHKTFKKWIPFKKVDSIDNINLINQIQIILDSL